LSEERHEDATRVLGVVLNGLDAAPQRAAAQRSDVGRWTLRLLAVAALITIGVGSALLLDAPDDLPALSSNGWVAQGGEDIWFLALGQEARRVTGTDADSTHEGCPAFSPDGRQLAYGRVTADPETYQDAALVIADVGDDGRVTDQLTIDIGAGLPPPCPVWSPSGDRIAFAVPLTSPVNPTRGAAGSEVRILTLADRSITVLPDLLATDLEFSPDGTLLGIASGAEQLVPGESLEDPRIHLYELAAGATRTLEGTLGAMRFTWSPDGGRIAYQTGDHDHRLRLIDVATEEQRELSAPFVAVHGIGPVWSPDGESIVYQRLPGSCCELHDVVLVWPDDLSADGTPREEVFPLFYQPTEDTERDLFPRWVTWSPDGEYLLFSAWPDGGISRLGTVPSVPGSPAEFIDTYNSGVRDSVYVAFEPFVPIQTWQRRPVDAPTPTATSQPTPVQVPSGAGTPLGWSSDGTQVLIQQGNETLFILHADGSETQVADISKFDDPGFSRPAGATISPDGSRVVFAGLTRREEGRSCHDGALFAVDADGGPAEVLWKSQAADEGGIVRYPTFSPDGTQIAFADGYCDYNHSVWVMNADGSEAHEIVSVDTKVGAGFVYGLAWSPAGDRIALQFDAPPFGIWTFATDGSGFTLISNASEFCWPGRRC
jgi:Tol biopolymer transport system component